MCSLPVGAMSALRAWRTRRALDLDGRVALVTSGSRGLGASLLTRLGDRAALRNQDLVGEAGAYPVLRT